MTDNELLELAAKAAHGEFAIQMIESGFSPLTDDGDAFRLAVKLRINVRFYWDDRNNQFTAVIAEHGRRVSVYVPIELLGPNFTQIDENVATRRAIVTAAAESYADSASFDKA